jgi:hypothetical protein
MCIHRCFPRYFTNSILIILCLNVIMSRLLVHGTLIFITGAIHNIGQEVDKYFLLLIPFIPWEFNIRYYVRNCKVSSKTHEKYYQLTCTLDLGSYHCNGTRLLFCGRKYCAFPLNLIKMISHKRLLLNFVHVLYIQIFINKVQEVWIHLFN